MASPRSSESSDDSNETHEPSVINVPTSPQRAQSDPTANEKTESGFGRFLRRRNKTTHLSLQDWDHNVTPYHDYVRQLVAGGWTNLRDLDIYMSTAAAREGDDPLVISVLDISEHGSKVWPEIYNELDLKKFMCEQRATGNVRLYMAQYSGAPSPALVETMGSSLNLDPRFFQWVLHNKGHIFTPSQRHNAPYLALGFGVLKDTAPGMTEAERFKVMVYIQPDETGPGWTGLIFFPTHTKHSICTEVLVPPPTFKSPRPPPIALKPKTLRELFLESFAHLTPFSPAAISPFYAISNLLRINCFCWNQIITATREEDRRLNGISDTSIGHAEEIKASLGIVQRAGSYSWTGRDEVAAKDAQKALEEDFRHLVDQTDLLWATRDKFVAMRQSRSEARWTALTNAFTYLFAPVTIMSGIYGMNVSQISGSNSNPNIWQFFVAVAVMNVLVLISMALYNLVHVKLKHGKRAGLKEVLCFAVGKTWNEKSS